MTVVSGCSVLMLAVCDIETVVCFDRVQLLLLLSAKVMIVTSALNKML